MIVSRPTLVEMTPFNFDKGKAITAIAKHLKIPMENILAFGDAANDLEMIEKVKYGFAMSNADPKLKKVAYKTILSNDEDGVAKELNAFFELGF